MPRYVLVWDVGGRVRQERFEARNEAAAREHLRSAEQLAPRLHAQARRFALRTHDGRHVAGWQGEAVREKPRQLRMTWDSGEAAERRG